ncbi:Beta-hexosaminidase subunit A1 [Aduncisulcus paluster]|uniref:Beta-hexosaminidase n=1 Tax=Aduncisulcus paluster TaxID=2918883 RepID=A0ABQ5KWA6_9EUKA|nr:Beta-hexosaminidase subunit A1 [Aduncisulcus paluster]
MKLTFVFAIALLFSCCLASVDNLWPAVKVLSSGDDTYTVSSDLTLDCVSGCEDATVSSFINDGFDRFTQTTFWNESAYTNYLSEDALPLISLYLTDDSLDLDPLTMDQSYNITCTSTDNIIVSAGSPFAALYAFTTLTQLIEYDTSSNKYQLVGAPIIIVDEPRFPWRGLMIDTARHFLPISTIKRQIRALVQNKLNVLHVHLVDAQSFPLVTPSVPELAQGAYNGSNGGNTFTQDEMEDLVRYGFARGVRVIPEIDVPGHSGGWRFGRPDVVTNCSCGESNVNNYSLDPSSDTTIPVMSEVFSDTIDMFNLDDVSSKSYIHCGGDEVATCCWNGSDAVKEWMAEEGISSYNGVTEYFTENINDVLNDHDASGIFWEEAFSNGMPLAEGDIIQVWSDKSVLSQCAKDGSFNCLLSTGWYLDQQIPSLDGTTHYEWKDTYQDFLNNEPFSDGTWTSAMMENVKGGEACMWSEQVNQHDIDARVWPRACATADVLWAQSSGYSTTAKDRLIGHRCRMVRGGIGAGPIAPDAPCEGEDVGTKAWAQSFLEDL